MALLWRAALRSPAWDGAIEKSQSRPPASARSGRMAIEGIAGQRCCGVSCGAGDKTKPSSKSVTRMSSRLRFLSGHVELKMFIGTDGKAKRIITQKSNLGAYESNTAC